MNPALLLAGALAAGISVAHSVLGERLILTRLFLRELPHLLGSDVFTKRTLRFAWHLTSIAWWAAAALFLLLAASPLDAGARLSVRVLAAGFAAAAAVTLAGSRGRHPAWPVFGAIAASAWWGAA